MPLERRDNAIDEITGISAFNDPSIWQSIKDMVGEGIRVFADAGKELIIQAIQGIKGAR